MHRHRPRRHDQPLPPPLQRTVRGLAIVRRSGPGIRTSRADTSSARNIHDNQHLTETACSPLAARGFCIPLVFNTLPGRALTQRSTVAGMYDLRRLQIKRCGRLGERPSSHLTVAPCVIPSHQALLNDFKTEPDSLSGFRFRTEPATAGRHGEPIGKALRCRSEL